MHDDYIKKKIGRNILWFQLFRNSNLAHRFHRKAQSSVLLNWLFIAVPIFIYAFNIFIIIHKKVFWNEHIRMSFVKDFSNSVVFSILYFTSIFLSSYYPDMFDEWIKYGIDKSYFQKIAEIYKHKSESRFWTISAGVVMLVIGTLAGYSFYFFALSHNGPEIWTFHIGKFGRIYYCTILGILWYHSISLLGMALSGGFVIFWSLKGKAIHYIKSYFNKNISVVNAVNFSLSTFSYGLFYILGSILFIFNDKIAAQNGINNTFSDNRKSFFLIIIVLSLVIAAFIPLQELFRFMHREKFLLINDYDQRIAKLSNPEEKERLTRERNEIVSQSLIITSISNKLFVAISILIPLTGVIFQAIEFFSN